MTGKPVRGQGAHHHARLVVVVVVAAAAVRLRVVVRRRVFLVVCRGRVGEEAEADLLTKKRGKIFGVGIFLGFVRRSGTTRTPHGGASYVRGTKRNRIGPHGGGIERLSTRTRPIRATAGAGYLATTRRPITHP